MPRNTRLGGSLPKSVEMNGLADIAGQMVGNPDDVYVAVVVLSTKKITTEIDTGNVVPTAAIRRIEPILDDTDRRRLGQIVTRAFERRTGKTVLPLDMEDEMREIFGSGAASE